MNNVDNPETNFEATLLAHYDTLVDQLTQVVKKESKSISLGQPNHFMTPEQEFEKYQCQMKASVLQGLKEMDHFKEAINSFEGNKKAFLTHQELDQLESEIKSTFLRLSDTKLPETLADKTIQDIFGISDFTLYCLYSVGYGLAQQGLQLEATNIFSILTMMNPLVKDYWMALAFSLKESEEYEKAAKAFIMASFMQDNDPVPHLSAIECFLAMGDRDNAEIGIEEVIEIINASENSAEWMEALDALKIKLK
jgi:type III secretion system low calcium response chaperone LcrH/SycD